MLLAVASLVFLLVAGSFTVGYLALAALARRVPGAPPRPAAGVPAHSFAILIPAHNEEAVLARVLRSCQQLDYPRERYQVFVIADHCTDATVAVARSHGVQCLERDGNAPRGKGAALGWALARIEGFDGYVIVDADCTLDCHALKEFDRLFTAGHRVLQTNNVAGNPDDSFTSYLAAVANRLENEFFYRPKSHHGLTVFLRGTGMVLHREVLARCPWEADGQVEDSTYTLALLRAGERVTFVGSVRVVSDFPISGEELRRQRRRWVGGNLAVARREVPRLVVEAWRRRSWLLLDAAWTLLANIRSLVLLVLGAGLLLAAAAALIAPGPLAVAAVGLGLGLVFLNGIYFALGVLSLGLTRQRLRYLLAAPQTAAFMLALALTGLLRRSAPPWLLSVRRPQVGTDA
ncbi:MAG: glycosyltransferase family 2 protein [Gemmataceae bacterium]|nr:glycosyltransferase family 2 protein [Gemmataceae bacterium]MDW8266967.1 glycosyltransferase family 2 protein [Gemmataceae bacterium]